MARPDDGERLYQALYNRDNPAEKAIIDAFKALKEGDKESAIKHLEDATNTLEGEIDG